MKHITKEYTVWKLDPKRVAVEIVFVIGVFTILNWIYQIITWLL